MRERAMNQGEFDYILAGRRAGWHHCFARRAPLCFERRSGPLVDDMAA
jgi:hypothetical protein